MCPVAPSTGQYAPPEVGAIDASSAKLIMVIMKQTQTAMVHQIRPAVPPLNRPNQFASSVHSQVLCRMVTKETMPMGESGHQSSRSQDSCYGGKATYRRT